MGRLFERFAQAIASWAGRPPAFALAFIVVLVWGISGPVFQFSDTWQLVINTGTTIVTFLMVFLIQNAQNRDAAAMQAKLDELIRALADAREKKTGRCADCPASYDEALFERLREWRLARASEDSVPAFVVFTDATLQLIAEHAPVDEKGLRAISGVGPSKLSKYGDEVLALVAESA